MNLMIYQLLVILSLFFVDSFSIFSKEESAVDPNDYGVDYSFPIHHYLDSRRTPHFFNRYHQLMKGCYEKYSKRECDATERARIEMNLDQPKSQHNYTEIGFKKLRLPEDLYSLIMDFYNSNKDKEKLENWPRGNTYVNNWESPSYMISFEDRQLRGGLVLKQRLWDGIKPIIEEWTGKKLAPTSLYGIRVYKDKAILATHVDRLPLISSCIIQVSQDINEPWPIEVYDHHGKAHNVTMVPGDMVLYESHTVLHGRPFPMNGSHYANIFVHFQPIDHEEIQKHDAEEALHHKTHPKSNGKNHGGHEQFNHDEDIVAKHLKSIEEEEKRLREEQHALEEIQKRNPNKHPSEEIITTKKERFPNSNKTKKEEEQEEQPQQEQQEEGQEEEGEEEEGEEDANANEGLDEHAVALRTSAALGELDEVVTLLKEYGGKDTDFVNSEDRNGWRAIHEAVRGGNADVVQYLVESGADIGAKVHGGGSALWVARRFLEADSEVIEYLISIGAPDDGAEL